MLVVTLARSGFTRTGTSAARVRFQAISALGFFDEMVSRHRLGHVGSSSASLADLAGFQFRRTGQRGDILARGRQQEDVVSHPDRPADDCRRQSGRDRRCRSPRIGKAAGSFLTSKAWPAVHSHSPEPAKSPQSPSTETMLEDRRIAIRGRQHPLRRSLEYRRQHAGLVARRRQTSRARARPMTSRRAGAPPPMLTVSGDKPG
ncbi:hypothetical protein [Reyranella sp.]|uniref:hypothetical protein n=1 Tax=Reyranella sp. TaxID=1929291 RepID=UPI00378324C4